MCRRRCRDFVLNTTHPRMFRSTSVAIDGTRTIREGCFSNSKWNSITATFSFYEGNGLHFPNHILGTLCEGLVTTGTGGADGAAGGAVGPL